MSGDPILDAIRNDFAGNQRWETCQSLLCDLTGLSADRLSISKVTHSNLTNRVHEKVRSPSRVHCVVALCDESATGDNKKLAVAAVSDGAAETVLVFELDNSTGTALLSPTHLVSLEHSPVRSRVLQYWPSIDDTVIPDPGSLRFALSSISKLQLNYTNDYWNPKMLERKDHGDRLALSLASRLNDKVSRPPLTVEHHPGSGAAIRTPYVRVYDSAVSPNSQTATYVCLFVSVDGSSVIISVQSGATVWENGDYRSIDNSILDARSEQFLAALRTDPELAEIILRSGASRDFPIEGVSGVAGKFLKYKLSNVACSVIPITSLPSDTEIRDLVREFVKMSDFLNRILTKPPMTHIKNGVTMIHDNIHWPEKRVADVLNSLTDNSPQIVLAGPPGTGKTFVARWFAAELLGTPGELNNDRITLVQFHPTYGYEDFVEGLRPVERNGAVVFESVPGPILRLSRQIHEDGAPRVLIIDEINRANLPRVFGELMYLLEYRDRKIDLMLHDGFSLPQELFIIATMNTADKSTRVMDVALRRRFDFFSLDPDVAVLRAHYESGTASNEMGEELYDGFIKLNEALREDLDKHRLIGHSYFMDDEFNLATLRARWDRQIAPLLDEYFFERKAVESKYAIEGFWPSAAT
jgi:MoxR-like ATPase